MLTYTNLLDNLEKITQATSTTLSDVGFVWVPPYHDMGRSH
ncbi:hypothetical protein [Coxiella-like endosymbiont]|nr:hypothetical protein [Coxiella-like endosymbiont]